MAFRSIYPFSLYGTQGYPAPSQRPVRTERPRFSFRPDNYSIVVDNQEFRNRLRRKSFTGDTRHPVLRQLSGGRVNIPVEHADEDSDSFDSVHDDGTAVHTTRITQPEKAPSVNNARKQEVGTTSSPVVSQKLKPLARRQEQSSLEDERVTPENRKNENNLRSLDYDPKKYDDNDWSTEGNVGTNWNDQETVLSGYDTEVNKTLRKALQKLSVQSESNKDRKHSAKQSRREEHEAEIQKQDELMKKLYQLHRFFIVPDGNCLYRAVAQATLGDQSQHLLLRQLATDHILEHKEEFKDIIEGDIDVFLSAAQLEGEWAGYPEVLALSRLLEININITTGGTPSNPNVHTRLHYFAPTDSNDKAGQLTVEDKDKFTQRESIWLSWLSNGHYDTFTDQDMENPHYEKWLQSRESRIRSDEAIANQMHLDETSQVLYNNDPILEEKENSSTKRTTIKHEKSPKISPSRINNDMNDWYTDTLDAEYKSSVRDLSSRSPPRDNFDLASAPPPEPHHYPPATYSKSTPQSTTTVESPPCSSSLSTSTEYDEEIARNLQKEEEDMAYERLKRKYDGYCLV